MWPIRYSQACGAFIDVRTIGDSIDITYISDSDSDSDAAAEARDVAAAHAAASAAATATAVGLLPQLRQMIGDDFYAERSVGTGVLMRREESPSPPAPADASATGRTYDDITKPPPLHLRCVVSPLSSLSLLSPMGRCVTKIVANEVLEGRESVHRPRRVHRLPCGAQRLHRRFRTASASLDAPRGIAFAACAE